MTHVLQPNCRLGRSIQKCPTCRCRRRFIVRVYEWFSPAYTCGGCGNSFFAGRRRYRSADERERHRQWVSEQWLQVPSVRAAVCEMVDELKQGEAE